MIDIRKTVDAILATKDVAFKEFSTDPKTQTVTLVTAVNDAFSRGIIVVEKTRVGLGTQGPDEKGTLVTRFQPLTEEIMSKISFLPEKPEEEPVKLTKKEVEKEAKQPKNGDA